jgi:histone H3/H4
MNQETISGPANKISKNEIKRLSEVAGVLRVKQDVYNEIRDLITRLVVKAMSATIIIANYKGRKTLKHDDLLYGLSSQGYKVVSSTETKRLEKKSQVKKKSKSSDSSKKSHRYNPGSRTRMNIVRMQKHSNKLMIRPKPFKDMVDWIVNGKKTVGKTGVTRSQTGLVREKYFFRISNKALNVLQFFVEHTVIEVLYDAYLIALSNKTKQKGIMKPRVTLFAKDIDVANQIARVTYD